MKNTQLLQFLEKLSSRELKKLEEMLHSPYFNKNERCIALFQLIKREILESGKDLDVTEVFKIVFPEQTKMNASLSVLMSKLLNLAQEVLVLEQLRLRPHTRNYLLLKSLGEKGDGENIQKLGKKSLKKIQSQQKWTKEDYQNNYLITNLLYDLEITAQHNRKHYPEKVVEALDAFYLSHRLPLTYEMMNIKQMLRVNDHNLLLEKVLGISESISLENTYLIQLYRLAVLLIREPEKVANFEQLLADLEDFGTYIPREEMHTLYATALNFCIQQIIKGKKEFYQRMFDIFKMMIAKRVLYITKYIPPGQIKNVVTLGCQLGKLDWTKDFLEEYSHHLDPKLRNSTYYYYHATIAFYQKDFEKAKEFLVKMESMDVFFEVGRRFVLLKIYYELKEEVALFQLMDSFNAFIRSNKALSAPMKTSYLNFCKMLKWLVKNQNKKRANQLEKLNTYQPISDKRWLMNKLSLEDYS